MCRDNAPSTYQVSQSLWVITFHLTFKILHHLTMFQVSRLWFPHSLPSCHVSGIYHLFLSWPRKILRSSLCCVLQALRRKLPDISRVIRRSSVICQALAHALSHKLKDSPSFINWHLRAWPPRVSTLQLVLKQTGEEVLHNNQIIFDLETVKGPVQHERRHQIYLGIEQRFKLIIRP